MTETMLDCLYLLKEGFRADEDHYIMGRAHNNPARHMQYARIMAASTSEVQVVKYLQFLIEGRPIEPGFRTKELDQIAGIVRS